MNKQEKKFLKNLQKINDRCLTSTMNENTYFYLLEIKKGCEWMFANDFEDIKKHIFWFAFMGNMKYPISNELLTKLVLEENAYEVIKNKEDKDFLDSSYKVLQSDTFNDLKESVNELLKIVNLYDSNLKVTLYEGAKQAYVKALSIDQKYEAAPGTITFSSVLEDILAI